jgi:hypothetical protein
MKKLQVGLPDDLRGQLDAAADKSGNSLGEEIRQRLERTIEQDAIDPVTRELLAGIVNLAAAVQTDIGATWHAHQEVHAVFAAAIAQRLAALKPVHKSPEGAFIALVRDLMGEAAASQLQEAPDAVGSTIERSDRRTHSYEHLQHLQTERTDREREKRARALSSAMRAKKGKKEEDK